MRIYKIFIGLGAGVFSTLLISETVFADSRYRGRPGEVRQEYRELQKSRAGLQKDLFELRKDRAELHRDIRRGASPREIARAREEVRESAREVARSRRDFSRDRAELRRDLDRSGYGNSRYERYQDRGNHYGWWNNDNRWDRRRSSWWNNDRGGWYGWWNNNR